MDTSNGKTRQHKRHSVALRVKYEGASGYIESIVGDISLGGLRIQGPISDNVGGTVELMLTLPHLEHDIPVHGEVVWVERDPFTDLATVGVRFLDLDPQLNVMLNHIFRGGVPE